MPSFIIEVLDEDDMPVAHTENAIKSETKAEAISKFLDIFPEWEHSQHLLLQVTRVN